MSNNMTQPIPEFINERIKKLEHYKELLMDSVANASTEEELKVAKERLMNFESILEVYKNSMKPILDSYKKEEGNLRRN